MAVQDAFLTGGDQPQAPPPRPAPPDRPSRRRPDRRHGRAAEHFAETLASLGFDVAAGDLPLDEVKFGETPEGKRRAAAQAAKARRKERKGERRGRGGR
jgi:23S rRNA pseudouridine955/2504/2580 synthase